MRTLLDRLKPGFGRGVRRATAPCGPGTLEAAPSTLETSQAPNIWELCELADRRTRIARAEGRRPEPTLEALVAEAASLLNDARSAAEEANRLEVAERQVRHAWLRVHLMKRHPARIFTMAASGEALKSWDADSLIMLTDAHAMVGAPFSVVRAAFRRLRSMVDLNTALALRDRYLETIGDHATLMQLTFASAGFSEGSRRKLRELVLSAGAGPLDDETRETMLRRAERVVAMGGWRARVAGGDVAVLAFTVADTLDRRLRALDIYEDVRREAPSDRSLHAQFQRFYVRLIHFIHTGGETDEITQPLEQEPRWIAYNQDYTGMRALTESRYWRSVVDEEARRRALFTVARPEREPNSIVFLSNTPKFSFALMDLVRETGRGVEAVQFDFIEDVYRTGRMIDLIARPYEACGSIKLRQRIMAHPGVARVAEAECIFVDFANRAAVWASWFKRPHQRLVIRLHAYEALSAWPYLINWAAVDGLVFVSPAIEAIFRRELGERVAGVPSVVVPNFKVLPEPAPARDEPGRTLGMLGAVIYRKQPVQGVRILKALQERDSPEWTLRLAGGYWPEETGSPETEHKAEFEALAAALPDPDSIIIEGFQSDIGGWFSKIDYLLSCSLREGTHEAVNEAMHFNVVPVVRDWPLVAQFGGARCVYPILQEHGLLYDDVDQAVEGILAARARHAETVRAMRAFVSEYLDNARNLDALLTFMRSV